MAHAPPACTSAHVQVRSTPPPPSRAVRVPCMHCSQRAPTKPITKSVGKTAPRMPGAPMGQVPGPAMAAV